MHEAHKRDPLIDDNAACDLNLELVLDPTSINHKSSSSNRTRSLDLRGILIEYLGSKSSTVTDPSSNLWEKWDSCKNAREYCEVIEDLLKIEISALNEQRRCLSYLQKPDIAETDKKSLVQKEYYLNHVDPYHVLTNVLPSEETRTRKRTRSGGDDGEASQVEALSRKRWKTNNSSDSPRFAQVNDWRFPDVAGDVLIGQRDHTDQDGDTAMLCEHLSAIPGRKHDLIVDFELSNFARSNPNLPSHQLFPYIPPLPQETPYESNSQTGEQNDFPLSYAYETLMQERREELVDMLQKIYKLTKEAEKVELRIQSPAVYDEFHHNVTSSGHGPYISATRNDEQALFNIKEQIIKHAAATNYIASDFRFGDIKRNEKYKSTSSFGSKCSTVGQHSRVKEQQGPAEWSIFEDVDQGVPQVNQGLNTGDVQDENMGVE